MYRPLAGDGVIRTLIGAAGAAPELHDMQDRASGAEWWPWRECPQLIIRFGYGPPGADSPRRRVDDILDRASSAC
jgi:hypothetical protein